MQEVEVKVRLADRDADRLRARLEALGAQPLGRGRQDDTFWRHPAGLPATGGTLRVRAEGDQFELTFKGPRRPGAVKIRRELNVPCGADPRPLLEALGFQVFADVSKDRESWRLEDLTVTVDRVAGVGVFAEVESLAAGRDAAPEAVAAVERGLERLGLADLPRVTEAYVQLALAARRGDEGAGTAQSSDANE